MLLLLLLSTKDSPETKEKYYRVNIIKIKNNIFILIKITEQYAKHFQYMECRRLY